MGILVDSVDWLGFEKICNNKVAVHIRCCTGILNGNPDIFRRFIPSHCKIEVISFDINNKLLMNEEAVNKKVRLPDKKLSMAELAVCLNVLSK
jgi:hypothetical protein